MSEAVFSTEIVDSEIKMSASAAEQMKGLMQNAEEGIEGIRVFVSGGGCGGMSYGMTFVEAPTEYDATWEKDGLKVHVDSVALGYLAGVEVDYQTEGANASFVFKNVFAQTGGSGSCGGCGGASGGGCG